MLRKQNKPLYLFVLSISCLLLSTPVFAQNSDVTDYVPPPLFGGAPSNSKPSIPSATKKANDSVIELRKNDNQPVRRSAGSVSKPDEIRSFDSRITTKPRVIPATPPAPNPTLQVVEPKIAPKPKPIIVKKPVTTEPKPAETAKKTWQKKPPIEETLQLEQPEPALVKPETQIIEPDIVEPEVIETIRAEDITDIIKPEIVVEPQVIEPEIVIDQPVIELAPELQEPSELIAPKPIITAPKASQGVVKGPKTMPAVKKQGVEVQALSDESAQISKNQPAQNMFERAQSQASKDNEPITAPALDSFSGKILTAPLVLIFTPQDDARASLSAQKQELLNNEVIPALMKPTRRINITAYAAPSDDGANDDKRIALARGLIIRGALIEGGVDPSQINVRSMGADTTTQPYDRAELEIIQ